MDSKDEFKYWVNYTLTTDSAKSLLFTYLRDKLVLRRHMMETQNITLSLPKSALRKVKLMAAKRNSSISRLVTDAIEKMLAEETNYEEAKKRQVALMKMGFDLGWQKPKSRDELHER